MKQPKTEKIILHASTREELDSIVNDATEDRIVHSRSRFTSKNPDGVVEYGAEIVRSKKHYLTEG